MALDCAHVARVPPLRRDEWKYLYRLCGIVVVGGANSNWNGNIIMAEWKVKNHTDRHIYGYFYDNKNRVTWGFNSNRNQPIAGAGLWHTLKNEVRSHCWRGSERTWLALDCVLNLAGAGLPCWRRSAVVR